jgi:UDP-2,3-diacylglucosamine pyrophosphatase LpxH
VNAECREEWEEPRGESSYRKQYQAGKQFYEKVFSKLNKFNYSTEQEKLDELYKAKQQFYDQRRVYNKQLAEQARADHLAQELVLAAKSLPSLHKPMNTSVIQEAEDGEAVLFLSDWHYGLETANLWNAYTTEIFIERLSKLVTDTKKYLRRHKPKTLHIAIMGDMINGVLRPSSMVEASELGCEQIMNVSEYLAETISDLAVEVPQVNVYSTYGNHARTVQKYVDSVHADNSEKLIPWWLQQRLKDVDNVKFMHSVHEFIYMNVCGKVLAAMHGDLDRFKEAASVVSAIFYKNFGVRPDYVVMGHVHHSSSFDELGIETMTISSMCGTDEYANSKRLYATPAQTLLFFNPLDGKECRYDIQLDTY